MYFIPSIYLKNDKDKIYDDKSAIKESTFYILNVKTLSNSFD